MRLKSLWKILKQQNTKMYHLWFLVSLYLKFCVKENKYIMYQIIDYDSTFFTTTLFTQLYVMVLLVENTRPRHSTKRRGVGPFK